ncbi:MAG: hypothetical protein RDV41_12420, partial [Planctomycetota bacterium]|nr:hypothetical protein [Planctomycetota bacterium]
QARRDSAKERYQKLAEDTVAAFSDLRVNLLSKGTHVPEDVAHNAASLNDRLKELQEKQVTEFEGYASRVCKILTDAQKAVIAEFKPCLLPPKSQKNPVLVGQGAEKDGAVNLLRRLRELPDKKLADKKEGFLKGQFEKAKKGGSDLTAEEKAAERDRLFKIVERVRAMSAEEFELEKSELAAEFEVKDRVHELRQELDKLAADRDPEREERAMAKYFTKPQMLPILEDRLKNLESFKQEGQVDLEKTTPTERPG